MDLGLRGVVTFVVGGTGLIGRATARQLYAEGADLVLGARSSDDLDDAVKEIGDDVGIVRIDTTDQASVDEAVADVVDRYGQIGALVITAAPPANTLDPERSSEPDQVVEGLQGKALGYLRVANAVLPGMREAGSGRVVMVNGQNMYVTGSLTGTLRNAGVLVAAKVLADDLAGTGVGVNVVNPGPVRDPASSEVRTGVPGESTPEQVASVVTFLASPVSGGISGESVAVGHKLPGLVGY